MLPTLQHLIGCRRIVVPDFHQPEASVYTPTQFVHNLPFRVSIHGRQIGKQVPA